MKLFFVATDPRKGTGYARVANKITNYLVNIPNIELVYFALSSKRANDINDRYIDSRIKVYENNDYGEDTIVSVLASEKPDVFIIYNDPCTVRQFLTVIPSECMPPVKILYIDIFYLWQNIAIYDKIKEANFNYIWTFAECWKNHLINDIGFNANIVDVLPHGVDFERFIDIPQDEAKETIGFNPDDFVILNMNRNSPRKLWSVTISAVLELLKRQNMDSKIKLFCGCAIKQSTLFKEIIQAECSRLNLDPEDVVREHIFFSKRPYEMTDTEINMLYNAADVGMNTCSGEGFGLTTLEHSYFNRPQIVSGIPVLKETLGKYGHFIEPKVVMQFSDNVEHIGRLMYCDPLDFADALEYYFKNPNERPNSRDNVKERYSWENVYKVLDRYFRNGAISTTK